MMVPLTIIRYMAIFSYTILHSKVADLFLLTHSHLHTLAGTFSSVYMASVKGVPEERFAIKHLIPTSVSFRIENELKFLQMLG